MKAVNLWKTLFCSVLAVTAFTACKDDDDNGYSGMPEITVNGGETVTVAGKLEGGKIEQTVEVVSKGDWRLTFTNADDASWVTPSAMSGKTGTTTLTFTLGSTSAERTAKITLTASSMFEGFPLTDEATITIIQSDGNVPTGDALYSENCGTKVEKVDDRWPYVDKYEGWTRGGSLDQKGVTYSGNSASVANSGKAFDPTDDEKSEVSGPPYVSMNTSSSVFYINDINIASNTNFTFTFTAAQQVNYSNGVVLGDVTNETIRFSASTDGENYSPVSLKVKKIATGYWYLCTAEFKLPAAASVDKISVRFDDYAGLANHGLRIDDFKLFEGGNGSELGDVPPEVYTKGTVAEAIAAGKGKNYEVAATVVAMHTQGILIGDASGVMLAFIGAAPEVSVNDAVTVKGETELRNGVIQFGKENLSIVKTGTGSYTTPAAEAMDGAAVNAYIATALENKAIYKYVKYNGEFDVSGNYYNVVISGTNTKGSVAYGKPEWASFDGKQVTVEGWLLGGTSNYLQTMATSVTENANAVSGKFTNEPTTFAATDPVAQTLNFTATPAAGAVKVELSGTNATMFDTKDLTATSVTVFAKGNNTTTSAYIATLKLMAADNTVLDEVTLTQEGKAAAGQVTISLNFDGNAYKISEEYVKTETQYTMEGYVFTLLCPNGFKYNASTNALLFGKLNAYIELPAIEGKKLVKVVVTSNKSAAGGQTCGIFTTDDKEVSGGAPLNWGKTDTPHTYTLAGTAVNTKYRLKSTASSNCQINKMELIYN